MYLAGAIRDTHPEDIAWRERFIKALTPIYARILNPLGGKTFNPETKEWRVGGIVTNARHIVAQDLWCVRKADIIVANFSSLASGYPSIGTVMEVGAAAGMGGKLVYSILDPGFKGHVNPGVFTLHPFLQELSSQVFASEDECLAFLLKHLPVLNGTNPSFAGAHQ